MIIPERSSNVKKIIVPGSLIRTAIIVASALFILAVSSLVFSIQYFSKQELYKQTFAKNQFLDNKLRELQSKVATTDSTLSRIQSFEQKLRVVANLDNTTKETAAIGALTKGDMDISSNDMAAGGGFYDLNDSQNQFNYKTSGLEYKIDDLGVKTTLQEQSLHDLYELLKDRQSELDALPTVWPVKGWVTGNFGYRVSPFTGSSQLHEGLDIAARQGAIILAPAAGRVLAVDTSESFGKTLLIDHGYGLVTMYGHNSEIFVKPGQKIKRGDILAAVGTTGRSTGPHLHYEIRMNGAPVNPRKYILE
jgi:murein DD-endopeptidase MepM/ murein hydrolase activator NlpD